MSTVSRQASGGGRSERGAEICDCPCGGKPRFGFLFPGSFLASTGSRQVGNNVVANKSKTALGPLKLNPLP